MDLLSAIKNIHSVRSYLDKEIEGPVLNTLKEVIDEINDTSNLKFQLSLNEPSAFKSTLAKYGKFENVSNYLAIIGNKHEDLDEEAGYYGEKFLLEAERLGLNTCWVGLSFSKSKAKEYLKLESHEKLLIVISLGYGSSEGSPHKSKAIEDISNYDPSMPLWFKPGLEAALLAPTAMNQQKFKFEYIDGKVKARSGNGFYSKVDLGIAKYHFEIGANNPDLVWI